MPLVVLAVRGAIRPAMWLRLAGFFVLGGLQGAVGWFMVESGFAADSTAVSAYRLVMHLGLALALYAAILWTALGVLRPGGPRAVTSRPVRSLAAVCAGLVGLTIVAGGFVAGLHAGLIYETFPLMGASLVPPDYAAMTPFLRNLTENLAAVQFDHRLLATVTAGAVLSLAVIAVRAPVPRRVKLASAVAGFAVLGQFGLGVSTLLGGVPATLATAHQATAVLLLTSIVVLLHLERRLH